MKYFFIGIKGSGMSALAQVLHGLGYKVTGSDKSEHFFTENALLEKGIKIHSFNKNNIKKCSRWKKWNTKIENKSKYKFF